MFLPTLDLKPGLYTENSDRDAVGRWKDGSNVRFFKSNPEKVGGWAKQIQAAFIGVCRAMTAWTTLTYARYAALGTSSKLYLTDASEYFDITPLRASGNLTNPFTTTNASKTITVADTAHGLNVGDHAHYSGATIVGGLDLNGEVVITTVIDQDTYQFDAASAATSGVTGGGTVAFEYEIPVGNVDSILGLGWGLGGWGLGTWGTGRATGTLQIARIWSLANWGEDLLASPVDAPIYVWLASGGSDTRAVLITNAPAQNRRVLVSTQIRIAISFGSHNGTDPDPMLIRWCDSEDYTNWTPDITNLAGDKRLDNGNEIITALITRGEIAVFTDTTIYAMTLSGDDLVFSFDDKGQTSGLMGPNAAVDVNGVVYAMGQGSFYTYDGQVKELQCDVHSKVFGDPDSPQINVLQAAKVYAAWNQKRSEVIWFFPSATSDEVDMCVGVSTVDGTWWLGTIACTAWLSRHPFTDLITVPLATHVNPGVNLTGDSSLFLQETGVDADGMPLPYFLESYDAEIAASSNGFTGASTGQGENVYRIKRLIPDFIRIAGNHRAYLKGRKWPQGQQRTSSAVKFSPGKPHIDKHMRARQMAVRIEGDELGCDISIGTWRVDGVKQGGR